MRDYCISFNQHIGYGLPTPPSIEDLPLNDGSSARAKVRYRSNHLDPANGSGYNYYKAGRGPSLLVNSNPDQGVVSIVWIQDLPF